MKLFLLRHGESGASQISDFARTLTEKGKIDSKNFGQILNLENIIIDTVLVSPFQRTQETWRNVAEKYQSTPKFILEDKIASGLSLDDAYNAIKVINDTETVLLISHQPMLSMLIASLVRGDEEFATEYLLNPASFAEIDISIVAPNGGKLTRLLSPPYLL